MPNSNGSRSVERALQVLCEIAAAGSPIGISDLARRTGLPKSTIHLSLQSMRSMGFVTQADGSDRYVLGLAAAQVGLAARDQSSLIASLSPAMEELATRSQEAVSLGVRTGHEVMFVKRFETSHVLRTSIKEGTRMPLHASASGKCLLVGMSDDELLELYPDETLPAQASNTLPTRSELLNELDEVRTKGFATSHDEFLDGVSGAAVPVRLGVEVVASLSIAGPTSRFQADGFVADLLRIVSLPLGPAPLSAGDLSSQGSSTDGSVPRA